MRGAFLSFEYEKAFRICTCIGELDTGEIKFWQSRFWTSLLPDSQISWIVTFVHFIQAVDGPAVVIVGFNHPSWGTQGLSAMMAVTPTYVTSAVLNTTLDVAEEYFPKESTPFLRTKQWQLDNIEGHSSITDTHQNTSKQDDKQARIKMKHSKWG